VCYFAYLPVNLTSFLLTYSFYSNILSITLEKAAAQYSERKTKMAIHGASQIIHNAVMQWPEIESEPHQFGGIEYRIGRREIGHTHGDNGVDIPFPRAVRDELVADGIVAPHHVLPDSTWISFYLKQPDDVEQAIALLQRSYEIVRQRAADHAEKKARLKPSVEAEQETGS
jgi:hypothetical protein